LDAQLFTAIADSLREADDDLGPPTPERRAAAHEAASQLALYLRHISSDFRAIDDLASEPPSGDPSSPARFTEQRRRQERRIWKSIEVLSYATLGHRPFAFGADSTAPTWDLTKPWTYPECAKDAELSEGTDVVYRTCYRACAGGPFRRPASSVAVEWRHDGIPKRPIEVWDNDGIVNTASMAWPGAKNVLVAGDHMDIVGHFHPVAADPSEMRRFRAYDLLGSASGFEDEAFEHVWKEIFDFAAAGRRRGRAAAAGTV
jgi:hypothetical protein